MSASYHKSGDWNAICDVCGHQFKASQLRKRWDGMRTCKDDWEERHPQDFLKAKPDNQNVPWTRPEGRAYWVTVDPTDPDKVIYGVDPSGNYDIDDVLAGYPLDEEGDAKNPDDSVMKNPDGTPVVNP